MTQENINFLKAVNSVLNEIKKIHPNLTYEQFNANIIEIDDPDDKADIIIDDNKQLTLVSFVASLSEKLYGRRTAIKVSNGVVDEFCNYIYPTLK